MRERMFVVQISLVLATFLSLTSQFFVINANHQRSQHTPSHYVFCRYVEYMLLLLLLLLSMSLVECWCMHMPHRPGRTSGVDQTKEGERRMNSYSIMSHATMILQYHASMFTQQNSVISRAL